jgi:hypothetical protein
MLLIIEQAIWKTMHQELKKYHNHNRYDSTKSAPLVWIPRSAHKPLVWIPKNASYI